MIAAALIGYFLLRKTRFFRQLYFIGSNGKAALLSGINVEKTMIAMFVIMGVLADFSGLMIASRLNVAVGTVADSINLQVIAAIVLGGGSLSGGRGSILGEVLHRIKTLGKYGGYIVAPSHAFQPDTPIENVIAVYETVHGNKIS